MADTGWLGGRKNFSMGPANVYTKLVSAGSWQDESGFTTVGRTESTILRNILEFGDLVSSQTGTVAYDNQITGDGAEIECNLAEATLERLEELTFDVKLIRDSAGDIVQALRSSQIGKRISDKLLWVKVVRIDGGADSTDPFDTAYFLGAPKQESVELSFTAADQRFYNMMFKCYAAGDAFIEDPSDRVLDENGSPAYWWTKENL